MPRPLPTRPRVAGAFALGLPGVLLAFTLRCRTGPRCSRALLASTPSGPRRSSWRSPPARLRFSAVRRPLPCRPRRSARSDSSADSASQLATPPEVDLAAPSQRVGEAEETPDVFLSHDWGVDELLRSNHERVARVNHALKERGYATWLDEERLEGYIIDQISEGIENAKVVVVFMTQQYYQKVNGDDSSDYCKLEFEYALRRRGKNNMVVCVMEPRMRDSRRWQGPIGLGLGGCLYVDLAEDDDFELKMDKLDELITSRIAGIAEGSGALVGPILETGMGAEAPRVSSVSSLLDWLPKPTSIPQAVFLFLVAVAAVAYYAFELTFTSASEVVSFLQDALLLLWDNILALIAAL